jgi:uncharacterized membrane protein
MTLAAIDWGKLFELVWASALAGAAVSMTFALLIVGISRASELRRADRGGGATAYAVLAILAALIFAAGVIFGISVIVAK